MQTQVICPVCKTTDPTESLWIETVGVCEWCANK